MVVRLRQPRDLESELRGLAVFLSGQRPGPDGPGVGQRLHLQQSDPPDLFGLLPESDDSVDIRAEAVGAAELLLDDGAGGFLPLGPGPLDHVGDDRVMHADAVRLL